MSTVLPEQVSLTLKWCQPVPACFTVSKNVYGDENIWTIKWHVCFFFFKFFLGAFLAFISPGQKMSGRRRWGVGLRNEPGSSWALDLCVVWDACFDT